MPQVSSNLGRIVRVPPAIVLQIGAALEGERYSDIEFRFQPVSDADGWDRMLLVPRSMIKLPDASRGYSTGSGERRWELVLRMN